MHNDYVSKDKTTSHTKKNKQHIYGYVENKNENRAFINAKQKTKEDNKKVQTRQIYGCARKTE
jgi:hypothetical protein